MRNGTLKRHFERSAPPPPLFLKKKGEFCKKTKREKKKGAFPNQAKKQKGGV
jgi:hypothetical protein